MTSNGPVRTLVQRFPIFVRIFGLLFFAGALYALITSIRDAVAPPGAHPPPPNTDPVFASVMAMLLLGIPGLFFLLGGLYADIQTQPRAITKGLFLFNLLRITGRTRSLDLYDRLQLSVDRRNGPIASMFIFIVATGPSGILALPGYYFTRDAAEAALAELAALTGLIAHLPGRR